MKTHLILIIYGLTFLFPFMSYGHGEHPEYGQNYQGVLYHSDPKLNGLVVFTSETKFLLSNALLSNTLWSLVENPMLKFVYRYLSLSSLPLHYDPNLLNRFNELNTLIIEWSQNHFDYPQLKLYSSTTNPLRRDIWYIVFLIDHILIHKKMEIANQPSTTKNLTNYLTLFEEEELFFEKEEFNKTLADHLITFSAFSAFSASEELNKITEKINELITLIVKQQSDYGSLPYRDRPPLIFYTGFYDNMLRKQNCTITNELITKTEEQTELLLSTSNILVSLSPDNNGDFSILDSYFKALSHEDKCLILIESKFLSSDDRCLSTTNILSLLRTDIFNTNLKKPLLNLICSDLHFYNHNLIAHVATHQNQIDIVRYLLEKQHIHINYKIKGYTLLHRATKRGHTKMVDFLLEIGANPNIGAGSEKSKEQAPLHQATEINNEELILSLIKAGADVNIQNNNGDTPLHLATKNGFEQITSLLIKAGADVNIQNNNGDTPLHLATKNGFEQITSLLIKAGADVNIQNNYSRTPLYIASKYNQINIAKMLIANKADVNTFGNTAYDFDLWTPLHIAVQKGNHQIAKLLIQNGAKVNLQSTINGWDLRNTPLHIATRVGNKIATQILLENGAKMNIQNHIGKMAFHIATKHTEIIALFISNGMDVDIQDGKGYTPLHSATNMESLETIQYLLEQGANIEINNNEGKTAFDLAIGPHPYKIMLNNMSEKAFDLTLWSEYTNEHSRKIKKQIAQTLTKNTENYFLRMWRKFIVSMI